jgi:hypothetical protein
LLSKKNEGGVRAKLASLTEVCGKSLGKSTDMTWVWQAIRVDEQIELVIWFKAFCGINAGED